MTNIVLFFFYFYPNLLQTVGMYILDGYSGTHVVIYTKRQSTMTGYHVVHKDPYCS